MGDNSTAIKTIAALVLLLIALAFASIFSYNPIPDITVGTETATPSATQAVTCDSDDESVVASCCQEWATNNRIVLPACEGSWSWTQIGGCTFNCTAQE